jgi:hypothetical protein
VVEAEVHVNWHVQTETVSLAASAVPEIILITVVPMACVTRLPLAVSATILVDKFTPISVGGGRDRYHGSRWPNSIQRLVDRRVADQLSPESFPAKSWCRTRMDSWPEDE